MVELIPDGIRARIEQNVSDLDPSLKRLEKVGVLGRKPDHTLTELTNDEAIDFALIEAINDAGIIALPGTVNFINLLKRNRVALDRKGIYEFIAGLNGLPRSDYGYGRGQPDMNPGTVYPEDTQPKKGFIDRLKFWKR